MTLVASHLFKQFGPTRAASDVSITLRTGTVHAIVGENGAGKSTTLRMLGGAMRPDSGEMTLDGATYAPQSIGDATARGVALVHQEITINRSLTIAENIFIGNLRGYARAFGIIKRKRMAEVAQAALDRIGVKISVTTNIDRLNLGELKCIEIARAISSDPKTLLLDESTAYLDHREVDAVLKVMRELKSQGMTIGFVSHHLSEVLAAADDLTILKDGQFVGSFRAAEIEANEIHRLMVGRDLSLGTYPPRPPQADLSAPAVMRVDRVAVGRELNDFSVDIRRGEILGLAGLKGAGAEALFAGIVGDEPLRHGSIEMAGQPYHPGNPRHAWKNGIAHLPGDRGNEGLIAGFTVLDNLVMARPPTRGPFFDKTRARSMSNDLIKLIGIRTASADAPCRSLSGGNMQKVVLGKCLAVGPELLLLNNPTRGVDVGARVEIYRLIRRKAAEGLAIILSSEDMPELIGMSDRLIVLRQGVVAREFPVAADVEEHDVVKYMT
ncbi:sugar ABC transporter ATP-binding protein [Acidisoma cellulosilytica]|uniref:Sugar ABC transporter ATP-binding protein n=1 Tax=Acidisoma cellulosilyticum TaxID=2802395 RepID=A0A963Z3V1_9PROT|nr:sugar ABC transporter ATP-binding protein [Acidisoma cellulosilyticum]MCB8882268.1 sugar ABC transporter ATP-binding protein [Acidisoma cellulosilyticum]